MRKLTIDIWAAGMPNDGPPIRTVSGVWSYDDQNSGLHANATVMVAWSDNPAKFWTQGRSNWQEMHLGRRYMMHLNVPIWFSTDTITVKVTPHQ